MYGTTFRIEKTAVFQHLPGVMVNLFLRGAVLGFCIAAPVGPIGVLCIRRSVASGMGLGLVTGLGAATADAIYGAIAGFGMTAISNFLVRQQFLLGLIGGLFLGYLGIKTFRSQPAEKAAAANAEGKWSAYASTLALTLTNPMTILSFVAIFAGMGLGGGTDYQGACALVAGVFAGSAVWWLFLSGTAGLFRSRLNTAGLRNVNRGSGIVIIAFGLWALSRLVIK